MAKEGTEGEVKAEKARESQKNIPAEHRPRNSTVAEV
jgi:hypothetical protein